MPQTEKQKQKHKVEKVMHEFKEGDLKSGSGQKVTNRKQAVAIAMSESGQARDDNKDSKKAPKKKTTKH